LAIGQKSVRKSSDNLFNFFQKGKARMFILAFNFLGILNDTFNNNKL